MAQEKKIYCGSGKKKSDNWLSVTLNPEKFAEFVQEYNGSKFIKLNINILNEPDKFGKDVSITIDTWKPREQANTSSAPRSVTPQPAAVPSKQEFKDLPF